MKSTFLNGLILVSPILLVRFILLSYISREALRRAAFTPPTEGMERIAYFINILTSFALIVTPFFLRIEFRSLLFISGLCLFLISLVLYAVSIIQFARPDGSGLNVSGLYRLSRNPMYVAFFLYFLACCMLTASWLLITELAIFQISVHFLILSEERWCKHQFGETYNGYMRKVRRYL